MRRAASPRRELLHGVGLRDSCRHRAAVGRGGGGAAALARERPAGRAAACDRSSFTASCGRLADDWAARMAAAHDPLPLAPRHACRPRAGSAWGRTSPSTSRWRRPSVRSRRRPVTCANLVSPSFNYVGIGVAHGDRRRRLRRAGLHAACAGARAAAPAPTPAPRRRTPAPARPHRRPSPCPARPAVAHRRATAAASAPRRRPSRRSDWPTSSVGCAGSTPARAAARAARGSCA